MIFTIKFQSECWFRIKKQTLNAEDVPSKDIFCAKWNAAGLWEFGMINLRTSLDNKCEIIITERNNYNSTKSYSTQTYSYICI